MTSSNKLILTVVAAGALASGACETKSGATVEERTTATNAAVRNENRPTAQTGQGTEGRVANTLAPDDRNSDLKTGAAGGTKVKVNQTDEKAEEKAEAKADEKTAAVPTQPRELLTALHMVNSLEIDAGRLAQKKGQSAEVKQFGQHLVRDHQLANRKVAVIAKDLKVSLPREMGSAADPKLAKQKADLEKLRGLDGAAFDRQFALMMVEGHQHAVDMVEAAEDKVEDQKLKGLLTSLLPGLEQHLDHAKKLADSTEDATAGKESEGTPREAQGRRPVGR